MRNLIIGFVLGLLTIGALADTVTQPKDQLLFINQDSFVLAGGRGPDKVLHMLAVNPDGSVNCSATVAK